MPEIAVQERPEVQALARQAADTISLATTAVVETREHVEWATAVLGEIARHRKAVEELRVRFTRPLNEHLKTLNGFFKGLDQPLAEADAALRQKVLAYRAAEQARAAAEQARLRVEAAARETEARALLASMAPVPQVEVEAALDAVDKADQALATAPPPPVPTVKTAFGTSTARRDWDFEVTDLAQVPAEYLLINGPAVRDAIRRGVRDIPGVRIYQKETLVVRG